MAQTIRRTLVAVVLSMLAGSAWAQSAPRAYYLSFCPGQPDCQWPAQELYYTLPSASSRYLVLGEMSLPYGKYMVTGKLTAYADGNTANAFNLECVLYSTADATTDWTDVAFQTPWASAPLVFEMPVNVTSFGGAKVGVKCRGMGHQDANPSLPATIFVWGGKIAAVQISSITTSQVPSVIVK